MKLCLIARQDTPTVFAVFDSATMGKARRYVVHLGRDGKPISIRNARTGRLLKLDGETADEVLNAVRAAAAR